MGVVDLVRHFAFVMLTIGGIGGLFVWWTVVRTDREMRSALIQQTRMIAQPLNVERLKTLTGTDADLGNSSYLWIKEQFATVRSANP